ncbi:MAG: hypothetical protein J5764_05755 [Bacteroidales bacterium]|nr:hypothetical protein [Bacteroidales bacterium]
MKKIFCLFLLFALGTFALRAQDILLMTDNEMVKVLVVEISDTHVSYHNFDNPDGPLYKVPRKDVARILFQNGKTEIFNVAEPAQSPVEPAAGKVISMMETRKGDLVLAGRSLSDDEISAIFGEEGLDHYNSVNRQRRLGITFISVGAPLVVLGDILSIAGACTFSEGVFYNLTGAYRYDGPVGPDGQYDPNQDPRSFSPVYGERIGSGIVLGVAGAGIATLGFAMVVAGIPNLIIGNNRLKNIAKEYNEERGLASSISLGCTPNGVGLAFNF